MLVKLKSSNYRIWKNQIENLLTSHDLDDLLNQEYEINEKQRQCKAKILIANTLNDEDKEQILECVSVKKIMEKLQQIYENPINIQKLNLELSNLEWTTESSELFIIKLDDIRKRLKNSTSEEIGEEKFIFKLIEQLPLSMNQLKSRIQFNINQNGDLPLFPDLCRLVNEKYKKIQSLKQNRRSFEIRTTNNSANSLNPRSCFKCGSLHHFSSNCPDKKCYVCQSTRHLQKNCQRRNNRQLSSSDNSIIKYFISLVPFIRGILIHFNYMEAR